MLECPYLDPSDPNRKKYLLRYLRLTILMGIIGLNVKYERDEEKKKKSIRLAPTEINLLEHFDEYMYI